MKRVHFIDGSCCTACEEVNAAVLYKAYEFHAQSGLRPAFYFLRNHAVSDMKERMRDLLAELEIGKE